MPSIIFWRSWTGQYKKIWLAIAAAFIFSMGFMWFSYFQGAEGVIHWEKVQEQKIIETTVHNFRLGPFQLTVPGESYVIFEYLQGSDLHHNTTSSYIFLSVMMVCAMMLLTVITTLERIWFFTGMSLFILFVISLRLDVFHVFGLQGIAIPTGVLVAYLATGFYFKSIRPDINFPARFASFILLTILCGLAVYFFSEIPFPMLQLAITAYIPALILSILFIIMIAHEIMASFIYITSQGGSKNLRHFSIISFIYLLYVIITSLHEIGYLQWDIIYINLYLLVSISAILGLWGFKLRENLYENIFPFSPLGGCFFLALGAICLSTLGQLLGNANDATLKVLRDIIIFTHAGFGIIFMMYVFSNFMAMMADNLPVYKVLYKPNRMPYFTFRFAGIIVTLAFIFVSHWRDYVYHSTAGFYNYVADLHMMQQNETLGRAFYELSTSNAYQNNRANYALAMIKASRLDFEEAHANLQQANGKRPTDFSLVNEGNLHLWVKKYFPAIDTYRAAEQRQPSPSLSNNLAFAYARIHNLDSAIYYIGEARKDKLTKSSAEANFFALIAAEYLPVETDSILETFNNTSAGVVSNALAAATLFRQPFNIKKDPLADKQLDLYSATLLNNYIIRNAETLDTTFTTRAYAIADDSVNFTFSEALKASLSYAFYHQGNIYKAQQILAELTYLTQSYKGKYNYILGLWALEQGSPENAHVYFKHAVEANYKQAKLYDAIALTEAGKLDEAMIAWDSVKSNGDDAEQAMADRVQRILTLDAAQALKLGDMEKYQYARYVVSVSDTAYFSRLSNTFNNPDYKAQALLDMSQKQFNAGRTIPAIRFFNQISGLSLTDKKLYDEIHYFELRMLASRGEIRSLTRQINKEITFDSTRILEKMLYTALVNEASGDLKAAEKNYTILGSWNPYFEEGIIAAANFFRNQDGDSVKPYDILAEAIQINNNSVRLLRAYAEEASRQGFEEYAESVRQRLIEMESL